MTARYSRSDIEDALPGGRWQPDGEYLVTSPLREEKTPSFRINPEKGSWYDFGGAEGGKLSDLFKRLGVADPWQENQPSRQEPPKSQEQKPTADDLERSERVRRLWEDSKPVSDHLYLQKKKISIEGLRVDDEGNLLVPGYGIDGGIISVERVSPEGKKRHLGPKQGTFFPCGDFKGDSPILLAEGFATAVSLHELSEWPAVGCFGVSGLLPVARAMKKKFPGRTVAVCPDCDDAGRTNGAKCKAAGFTVLELPPDRPKGHDWNDEASSGDIKAAQDVFFAQLEAARAARVEGPGPEPTPEQEHPQEEGNRRGFRLKRIGEFEMTPPEFLVRGLLEKDTLISVFGPSESGKSFIAISLAACVSTGLPFMGRHVEEGPIVYIAGEGKAGILRRTAAWEIFNGVSLGGAPFYLSEGTADFLDDDGLAEVITEADKATQQEGRAPILIVVDTVSRAFGAGDENSSQDMKKFVDSLDFLRERYTRAVVMAVHHSGVSETSRGRGSSVLRAALDAEFKVSKDDEVIKMESTKMKDAERPKPLNFVLEKIHLGETVEGEPFGGAALRETEYSPETESKLTPSMRRALETFRKAAKEAPTMDEDGRFLGVHCEDWRPVFYAAATASTTDGKWRAFDRARKDLVDRGKLKVQNDIYTAVEPADELLTNQYARSLKSLSENDTTTKNDNVAECRSANMEGERQTTTPPLKGGVVSFPVCRPEEGKSGDISSTARDEKMENHPSPCGEKYPSLEDAEAWGENIPGRLSELKARAIKELDPSDITDLAAGHTGQCPDMSGLSGSQNTFQPDRPDIILKDVRCPGVLSGLKEEKKSLPCGEEKLMSSEVDFNEALAWAKNQPGLLENLEGKAKLTDEPTGYFETSVKTAYVDFLNEPDTSPLATLSVSEIAARAGVDLAAVEEELNRWADVGRLRVESGNVSILAGTAYPGEEPAMEPELKAEREPEADTGEIDIDSMSDEELERYFAGGDFDD